MKTYLVENQTNHECGAVVDAGLEYISQANIVNMEGTHTAGGRFPVPAKKIGQWTALRNRLLGYFFLRKNVSIGRRAPIQNICRSPEYLCPMLYSRAGPMAVCVSTSIK
jgi:hypothetical protein